MGPPQTAEANDDGKEDRPIRASMLPRLPPPEMVSLPSKDVHVAQTVWPLDKHNIELLDNVHPHSWVDPSPHSPGKNASSSYDLVVIGAGSGGLVTAAGGGGGGSQSGADRGGTHGR